MGFVCSSAFALLVPLTTIYEYLLTLFAVKLLSCTIVTITITATPSNLDKESVQPTKLDSNRTSCRRRPRSTFIANQPVKVVSESHEGKYNVTIARFANDDQIANYMPHVHFDALLIWFVGWLGDAYQVLSTPASQPNSHNIRQSYCIATLLVMAMAVILHHK